MEYDIHKCVVIGVWSLENKSRCVLMTLKRAVYTNMGSGSLSAEVAMLHRSVSAVAQNRQTSH